MAFIYAFPVQQSVAVILPGISVAWMVVISFEITLLLALLSWHLVEKNFLQVKGHYVAIEKILRIPRLNKIEYLILYVKCSFKQ